MREFVDSGIKLVSGFQSMVLRKFNFGIENGDFLSAFFFVISSVSLYTSVIEEHAGVIRLTVMDLLW